MVHALGRAPATSAAAAAAPPATEPPAAEPPAAEPARPVPPQHIDEALSPFFPVKRVNRGVLGVMATFRTCGACDGDLVRLGNRTSDGGYAVCPSALAGAAGLVDVGIREADPFGYELAEAFGIAVHMFDWYWPRPPCPAGFRNCGLVTHHGVCLGRQPGQRSLAEVVARHLPPGPLLLKIDCEGCEWEVLQDAPLGLLARFRSVAMEWHFLPGGQAVMRAVQEKLLRAFRLLHTHGCNCEPLLRTAGGSYWMPTVVEGLLVRRDLCVARPCIDTEYLPAVDRPVCPTRPEHYAQVFRLPDGAH